MTGISRNEKYMIVYSNCKKMPRRDFLFTLSCFEGLTVLRQSFVNLRLLNHDEAPR